MILLFNERKGIAHMLSCQKSISTGIAYKRVPYKKLRTRCFISNAVWNLSSLSIKLLKYRIFIVRALTSFYFNDF